MKIPKHGPIPRRVRVEEINERFKKYSPFTNYKNAFEKYMFEFYQVEDYVKNYNDSVPEKTEDSPKMSIPMIVPWPENDELFYALTTKHILIFSLHGAFAMYYEEDGIPNEGKDTNILLYKTQKDKLQYQKLNAYKKTVWD